MRALSELQQRLYRTKCSIALAPLVGFIYLIFNPRFTWIGKCRARDCTWSKGK